VVTQLQVFLHTLLQPQVLGWHIGVGACHDLLWDQPEGVNNVRIVLSLLYFAACAIGKFMDQRIVRIHTCRLGLSTSDSLTTAAAASKP